MSTEYYILGISGGPIPGDFPPGRLDFVFTNNVMSVDKSFIISTEHMSPLYCHRIIYLLMIQISIGSLAVIVDLLFQ